MPALLRLVRFPNLVIVAITQYLLQYLVLVPAFEQAQVQAALDLPHFTLLVFSTILIAASGYIINDLIDYDIDCINKPQRVIINRYISMRHAYQLYYSIIALGLGISLYLAFYIDNLPLILLYPTAVFLLFLYSRYFKQRVLIGNVIVAIFCAFVAGIVWFAERHTVAALQADTGEYLRFILWFYLVFAFLSTMYREIIKDIEDQAGDAERNCRTLPIVFGNTIAKYTALGFGISLLVFLLFIQIQFYQLHNFIALGFSILAISLPLSFSFAMLQTADQTQDFKHLSRLAKFLMLTGLVLLFLIA